MNECQEVVILRERQRGCHEARLANFWDTSAVPKTLNIVKLCHTSPSTFLTLHKSEARNRFFLTQWPRPGQWGGLLSGPYERVTSVHI